MLQKSVITGILSSGWDSAGRQGVIGCHFPGDLLQEILKPPLPQNMSCLALGLGERVGAGQPVENILAEGLQ